MNRRNFLKKCGLAVLAGPAMAVAGKIGAGPNAPAQPVKHMKGPAESGKARLYDITTDRFVMNIKPTRTVRLGDHVPTLYGNPYVADTPEKVLLVNRTYRGVLS